MNEIDEKTVFSHPRPLKSSSKGQVIRFRAKLGANSPNAAAIDCVLKLFPECFRILYDKEVAVYQTLLYHKYLSFCPTPLGKAEWTFSKYAKVVGQKNAKLNNDGTILVLMLEFVDGPILSPSLIKDSKTIAIGLLKTLNQLHACRIVHGDVSLSNVKLLDNQPDNEPRIVWLDFSSSWIHASKAQLDWETKLCLAYVAKWVEPV